MTDYEHILAWAVNEVDDPRLVKDIRTEILDAFGNPHDSKGPRKWNEIYLAFGGFKNLPTALKQVPVGDRYRSDKMLPCRWCATEHGEGWICNLPSDAQNAGQDRYMGRNCGEFFARFGLPTGVLTEADKRTIQKRLQEQAAALDDLVLVEEGPLPNLADAHALEDPDKDFLGSQLGWLENRYDQLPQNVKAALDRIKDPYLLRTPQERRADLRLLLDHSASERKFPAAVYEGVADDLELMGDTRLAGVLRTYISKESDVTGETIQGLLGKAERNYRAFRIEKNTETLQRYEAHGATLAGILNSLAPVVEHDKPLWHADLVRQRYLFNKVLAPGDYRKVSGSFNLWRFGHTSELAGADALKLRNRAIRREPVKRFRNRIEQLVAINRKVAYAHAVTNSEEYAQLAAVQTAIEAIPEEKRLEELDKACQRIIAERKDPAQLLAETCIPVEAFRDYAGAAFTDAHPVMGLDTVLKTIKNRYAVKDRILREFQQQELPTVMKHADAGLVRKEDIGKIVRMFGRAQKRVTS